MFGSSLRFFQMIKFVKSRFFNRRISYRFCNFALHLNLFSSVSLPFPISHNGERGVIYFLFFFSGFLLCERRNHHSWIVGDRVDRRFRFLLSRVTYRFIISGHCVNATFFQRYSRWLRKKTYHLDNPRNFKTNKFNLQTLKKKFFAIIHCLKSIPLKFSHLPFRKQSYINNHFCYVSNSIQLW